MCIFSNKFSTCASPPANNADKTAVLRYRNHKAKGWNIF